MMITTNQFKTVASIVLMFLLPGSLFALGTYAEGSVTAKIIQFESRGIMFDSYEGIVEITTYNKEEKCLEAKDECYAPIKKRIDFSVRPENAEIVNTISKSVNSDLLLQYRVHRITAIALSSEMEIVGAQKQEVDVPASQGDKYIGAKSGSKRNFSVSGKVLQLDYQGTFIGTYEGLYLDEERGKIHAFSVTNEQMAKYAQASMKSGAKYNMGISVSFAKGFRKSDYDLFEINYKAPAGGSYTSQN